MSEQDPVIVTERQAVDGVRVIFGVGGLIALIIGVLIIVNPLQSAEFFATILASILALYLGVMGVVYLGTAVFSKSVTGWARTGSILLGLFNFAAAVILFANLGLASSALLIFIAVLVGVMWIVEGLMSFTAVKSGGHPVLAIVYGILSIAAGAVLLFSFSLGIAVLVWMIGISLVVLGIVQIIRAFTITSVNTAR